MARRSQPEWQPPPRTPGRRGFGRSYDPFYQFEQAARDNGKAHQAHEPQREPWLLTLLGTKAVLAVMGCLLVAVVGTLLVLLVIRL
jgi:hypothetical protein